MVKYHLVENFLLGSIDNFIGHITGVPTYDQAAVIKRILQSGTTVTKTDILASWNLIEETIVAIISEGAAVATPLFYTGFSIAGKFNGPMDLFDDSRHKLKVNISSGTLLRKVQKKIKLEKIGSVAPSINIIEVEDFFSDTSNNVLTSKGVVKIYGTHIKIVGENENCGLYFVADDGTETKASRLIQNKPSELIAMVPELKAGMYKVKVATQYNGHYDLNQARTVEFKHDLTVYEP